MKYTSFFIAAAMLAVFAGAVKAQTSGSQGSEAFLLDKIIVSNRRAATDLSDASENVEVVTKGQIESLPARNLSEALSHVQGVDIEPRLGFGRETSVSIQGSFSSQVRVMVDGIPFNSLSSGQVNPSILPIDNARRIEVIKGASSSLWGSGLGGTINVITKDTGDTLVPEGSMTTSLAEFRTKKDTLDLAGKAAGIGYYLMADYMESGGEGPQDDVLEKKAFGKLSYDLEDLGTLGGSFGYSQASVNTGVFPDGIWEAQPYRLRYGKLSWQAEPDNANIGVELKHSRQELHFKTYASLADQEPISIVDSEDLRYQLSLTSALHPRQEDLLVVGADFDWDMLKSTYLGQAKSQQLQAPFANYTLKLAPWDFNYGLRYDRNSEFGEDLSPCLGAVYHFNDAAGTLARFNAARAFNAPPLLWRFFAETPFNAPNPDLKAERAWVYEAGAETRPLPRLWTKLSLYYADVSDAIASAVNEQGKSTRKNFKKFRRQGAELANKLNILEGLNLRAGAAFNDVEDRATRKTVRGSGIARQSFNFGLEYKSGLGLSLNLLGNYNRWNEEAVSYFDQAGQEVIVDANDRKMIYDLKIAQELKSLSLFLNIYNLANSNYWADYNYPTPGRYFEGGVTLKW